MLRLDRISKTFDSGTVNARKVLDEVSLQVKRGEFVTIIGSNGAGKSTLFNAICGSFITDSGKLYLDGEDITLQPEHKRAFHIGRLFQDASFSLVITSLSRRSRRRAWTLALLCRKSRTGEIPGTPFVPRHGA